MQRFLSIALALAMLTFAAADWRQFRGPDQSASQAGANLPKSWDVKEGANVAWTAPLVGKGVSGPIVVAGQVIVTADSGPRRDRLHVLAFDAATGKKQWERQFWATGRTFCHPVSAVAAPTPASDGERIFAFFSSNDLACLDLAGNLLWYRGLASDFPLAGNDVGMSSSPVVSDNTVIVQVENQGDSFAAGIDAATGETRWRMPRLAQANWASPAVLRGKSAAEDQVVLQDAKGLVAVRPCDGTKLWSVATECNIIPSPTPAGELLLVPSGGLTALKLASGGGEPEIAWKQNKLAPSSPSAVAHDGRIYAIGGSGVLNCGRLEDGEQLWQLRLGGGRYWATPLVAGDTLYSVSDKGTAHVVQLGADKGEILAEIEFGEAILGSPAADDSGLYFRSEAKLWKIAEKK